MPSRGGLPLRCAASAASATGAAKGSDAECASSLTASSCAFESAPLST